jgi:nitroreductase
MVCSGIRERLARLTRGEDLVGAPDLAAHLETCPGCRDVWRLHLALLAQLAAPWPAPDFPDIMPRVLAVLDAQKPDHGAAWRWAMAASFALAALALGYLFGTQSAEATAAENGMATAYQEALTILPPSSAEVAFLDPGQSPAPDPSASNTP